MRVVLIVALLGGCVGVDEWPDVPFDGGRDTPPTPLDAPRDVPRRDVAMDVPLAFDPEWATPLGVPADCVVERARHPERLAALSWEGCGEGCTRADLGTVWNAVAGFREDGQAFFELLSDDFGVGTATDALASMDGPLLDAWRHVDSSETNCLMFNYEVGEGRAAALAVYIGDRDAVILEDRFWTFDVTTGPEDVPPDVVLAAPWTGNTRHTQEFVVSPALLAVRIAFGQVVVSRDGVLEEVFPTAGFDLGLLGDHLTFLDVGADRSLVHWTPERGTEVLYDPPEPLQALRQDGTTLAWARLMDFVGGLATRAELWTAELVTDPSLFAPRLVNDHVEPDGELGGGVYGWTQNSTTGTDVHLIDLDSGRHRVLATPEGTGCLILYLGRDEVALGCTAPGGIRSIYRYDPDLHASLAPAR